MAERVEHGPAVADQADDGGVLDVQDLEDVTGVGGELGQVAEHVGEVLLVALDPRVASSCCQVWKARRSGVERVEDLVELPFNPQGYRVRIAFPDAGQLADQADVRIAGVSVGKVLSKSLDPQGNRTIATIQLNNAFAPIHKDARAILREKTILGETYVQLRGSSPLSGRIGLCGVPGVSCT